MASTPSTITQRDDGFHWPKGFCYPITLWHRDHRDETIWIEVLDIKTEPEARQNPLPTPYNTADINLSDAALWRALANRLDDPRECDPAELSRTYARRLEALLEDGFDACGVGLAEKASSVRSRISGELLLELSTLRGKQERSDSPTVDAVTALCDRAVAHLLTEVANSQPRAADGGIAYQQWMVRHPTLTGVVRKISKYDEGLQHAALMDLDGHLIELRTSKIIRIDLGDRVVLLRHGKYGAIDYYNVTKKIGVEFPSNNVTYTFLAVGGAFSIAGIAGLVVTALLAIRSIHAWSEIAALLKSLVVAVPSAAAVCIGFVLLIMGIVIGGPMIEYRRAVLKETEVTPR